MKPRSIDDTSDQFAHVDRGTVISRDEPHQVLNIVSRRFRFCHGCRCLFGGAEVFNDVANHAQRLVFVLSEVVCHPGLCGVHVCSTEFFRGDFLPCSRFDEGWTGEENGAVALDDDGLIGHGWNVGAPGRARSQHGSHLGDAVSGHSCLIAENAAEMPDVGKHFVLHRQEGATGVNEVDARQVVFMGDGLRSDVFLDRHGVVRSTLDSGVVGNEEALASVDHADAGDDTGRVCSSVVEVVSSKRREFQEGRTGVNDALDAFSSKVFASGTMAIDVLSSAALGGGLKARTQFFEECQVVRFSSCEVGVCSIDSGRQSVHAEPSVPPRRGLHLIPFKARIGHQTPSINRPMSRSPGAKPTMSTARTMRRRKCCWRCSTRI